MAGHHKCHNQATQRNISDSQVGTNVAETTYYLAVDLEKAMGRQIVENESAALEFPPYPHT